MFIVKENSMEEEIKDLKLEIKVLKERISTLERIETRRKTFKILKVVIYLIVIMGIVIYIYTVYQNIMNAINNNPINSILDSFKISPK